MGEKFNLPFGMEPAAYIPAISELRQKSPIASSCKKFLNGLLDPLTHTIIDFRIKTDSFVLRKLTTEA